MREAPVAERVLDATASITVEHGWAAVTMARTIIPAYPVGSTGDSSKSRSVW